MNPATQVVSLAYIKRHKWQQQLETHELYCIHSTSRHGTNFSDFSISAGYLCVYLKPQILESHE